MAAIHGYFCVHKTENLYEYTYIYSIEEPPHSEGNGKGKVTPKKLLYLLQLYSPKEKEGQLNIREQAVRARKTPMKTNVNARTDLRVA